MELELLREIGLTDGEIKVYLALLNLGSSTTGPIADKSNVASSKIYHVLERLMQKNLVTYIIKEKTKFYQAEDPISIQQYFERKESEFKKKKEKIEKLVPQLQLQKKLAKNQSEAQIYKGFKGIQTLNEHVYAKLKRGEGYYTIGIPSQQEERYHLYWQRDHVRREKAGIKAKMLFNPGTPRKVLENRNSYKYAEARYSPLPLDAPAWFSTYKDVTIIVMQEDEGMAIEIINQKIADSFKAYFEALWKMSKPFT